MVNAPHSDLVTLIVVFCQNCVVGMLNVSMHLEDYHFGVGLSQCQLGNRDLNIGTLIRIHEGLLQNLVVVRRPYRLDRQSCDDSVVLS